MALRPLVSIGLPVYNGMPLLRTAVETLLKQSYAPIELVISDNASDDGTSEYCQALAHVHPNIRYERNPENIGPAENFRRVLLRSTGEYFLWAADDDKWSPDFVARLADSLSARPEAVLATPAVIHMWQDGSLCSTPPDRPATGESARSNLRRLFDDHAATWIYGMWRRDWLLEHVHEYYSFPYWGADVLWLTDICLRYPVVGNQEAVIFKRFRRNSYAPQSARASIAFWSYMFWHLGRISIRRTHGWRDRTVTVALAWRYAYQLCIRRPHIMRTVWRVVRMLLVAGVTSTPLAARFLWRQMVAAKREALSSPAATSLVSQ